MTQLMINYYLLCHKVCCFSHSLSCAGVKLAAAADDVRAPVEVPRVVAMTLTGWFVDAAFISWPNLSTCFLLS